MWGESQKTFLRKQHHITSLNVKCEGRVLVIDMDWSAKSLDDNVYKKGEKVIVERIEGVKCLVRKG